MIDDDEFKLLFKSFKTNNKDRIRYIFRKIHRYLSPADELNINNMDVHIEHIMPSVRSEWPHITEEIHNEYLWRLGNLCLLGRKLNQAISKKPFESKKENAYKDSKIEPNSDLMNYEVWDQISIEDRQQKLADYAVEIWK